MTPKSKKQIIIIVPIVVIVIIATLVVLYFTTDALKSKKTLFLKYMAQNVDAAKIVIDNKSEKEYTNKLKQNKYESTTDIKATYKENMNSSVENQNNDINKMSLKINTQSDYLSNYSYRYIKYLYNNKNALRAEYIHDGEIYGLRFPDKFSQFLTIQNNNLKQVAQNAGFGEELVGVLPDSIQEYDYNSAFSFNDEEIETLKNTYINILNNNINKDKYSKQKNALITINEQSINTTAYSITMTQEEANNLRISFLEQLKTDEILLNKLAQLEPLAVTFNLIRESEDGYNSKFLEEQYVKIIEQKIEEIRQNNIGDSEVKYTVYQSNGKTIRTQITEETKNIIFDIDVSDANNLKVNIQNENVNEEQENEENIQITKTNAEGENKFSIKREKTLGEDVSSIELYRNKTVNESDAVINTGIIYNDGNDNLLEFSINDNVTFNSEFEKNIKELDNKNSVIINDYEERLVTSWVNQVIEYLNSIKQDNQVALTNAGKINIIAKIFDIPQEPRIITETVEKSEVEKNRFNSKFEFYTGKEKTTEDVIKLLDEARTSLKNAQVSYSNEGSSEVTKKLQSIKLEVENGADKVELADSIKEMLEPSRTYTVETVKDSNELVIAINITINN